jgi:hypothetical protein
MKKRLEADLISIAHRILKIKNKSDINQLYLETQKLYEKLSVLRFIEENYGPIKPTIGYAEMQKEIESFYDSSSELPVETVIEMTESNVFSELTEEEPAVVENAEVEEIEAEKIEATIPEENSKVEKSESPEFSMEEMEEDIEEETAMVEAFEADIQELQLEPEENDLPEEESQENPSAEETVEDITPEEETPPPFKAAFELTEDTEMEIPKQAETMQISFADLLGGDYSEPHFVKVDDVEALVPETMFEAVQENSAPEKAPNTIGQMKPETEQTKNVSLNDKLSKGIDIDLNDRIAFVKHLFGNSNEDYNRVLNQLITFDNFYETKSFIEEMVKPDYNDWKGKDDYAERFMDIIEKKFL